MASKGNRNLLVVVDRASIFLLGHPLASKESLEVSRKLMELTLTFSVPQLFRESSRRKCSVTCVGG